ncbi:heme-degrading domain-containing protein [Devosia rhodophyticola]|uniref:Heme-degrading domain-containing protein n=1 Tax=Devosia rhodophyticola TaxID=3026423 RepID=A0ABY7YW00_9HYPH|nr:heme-degrading domain-containing protein [Devosia rhodophyticola]WDR05377.1 heme-degrading domain-containing protein [Devosia rhodophyticola]
MSKADDIAGIIAQEQALEFTNFDEHVAFELGGLLYRRAVDDNLSFVMDVRTWDRQMFFAAMPGTSADNSEWVRRKINSVRRYHRASYRLFLERDEVGLLPPISGADPADFVAAGGGFPIRVKGAGIIGSVTISGLPSRGDHNVVVAALCQLLGKDAAEHRLAPE